MLNIDPWDILETVANLLILFFLLRKFLFKPVIMVMDKRQNMINEDIQSAQEAKAQAEELKRQYEEQIADIKTEADKITDSAVERAEIRSRRIIDDARNESQKIIAQAHEATERERAEILGSAKEEIADLAVMAAARIMEKNIDEQSNLVYARQLLEEVGAADE